MIRQLLLRPGPRKGERALVSSQAPGLSAVRQDATQDLEL